MYNPAYKGDVCSHTHALMLDNPLRRLIHNPERIVGDYINPGDLALDIGCGSGFFTVDMARMVGDRGRVIAVDLQPEMLEKLAVKAARHQVGERILRHRCTQEKIGLDSSVKADFILAYYMVHETPDHPAFLAQVRELLKPGGRFLMVEPMFHVSAKQFGRTLAAAVSLGLRLTGSPKNLAGRSALFTAYAPAARPE